MLESSICGNSGMTTLEKKRNGPKRRAPSSQNIPSRKQVAVLGGLSWLCYPTKLFSLTLCKRREALTNAASVYAGLTHTYSSSGYSHFLLKCKERGRIGLFQDHSDNIITHLKIIGASTLSTSPRTWLIVREAIDAEINSLPSAQRKK